MKIGIMSDSHGNRTAIEAAAASAGDVDLWLHAGDCCPDADYLGIISATRVIKVRGNCDYPSETVQDEELIEAGGHTIFLTHGHTYGVKWGTDDLAVIAANEGADIVVYGHTHIAEQSRQGSVLILNPGSISQPRDGSKPSFMLLSFSEGKILAKQIKLNF
jgi:putative phosphoesterase